MAPICITLYHASWCGHCTNFLPKFLAAAEKLKARGEEATAIEEKDGAAEAAAKQGKEIKGWPMLVLSGGPSGAIVSDARTEAGVLEAVSDEEGKAAAAGRVEEVPEEEEEEPTLEGGGPAQRYLYINNSYQLSDAQHWKQFFKSKLGFDGFKQTAHYHPGKHLVTLHMSTPASYELVSWIARKASARMELITVK